MNCTRFLLLWVTAGIVSAAVTCTGCKEKAATTRINPTAPVPLKPTTPEESLQVILDTFKRGIEDVQAGFVAAEQNGHTMLTTTNKVTHEIFPPAGENEPYRANIIVTSTSRFSMQRSESEEEKDRKKDKESQKSGSTDLSDPSADPNDAGIDLPSSIPNKSRINVNDGEVARIPDESKRVYELVYKDGRWTLVTELNKDTEKSIQNAFQHALATQS
jgi:hypothetical protein